MKQDATNPPATEPVPTAQEVREALYDGADLTVTHQDGRRESVKVRKIPRNAMAAYALVIDESAVDETAECLMYVTGRDRAWADSLSDESFSAVIEEGQRLNFTCFTAWFRRRTKLLALGNEGAEAVAAANRLLAANPNLSPSTPRGSRNGSPAVDTPRPSSGPGRRTS